MKVEDIIKREECTLVAGQSGINRDVKNVYLCDLLSWVMSHAKKDEAWVTVMTNINIVAVALLTEVSCIIIPEGIQVEKDTILKADKEGIPIITTNMTAYDTAILLNKEI